MCNDIYFKKIITIGKAKQNIFIRYTKVTRIATLTTKKIDI